MIKNFKIIIISILIVHYSLCGMDAKKELLECSKIFTGGLAALLAYNTVHYQVSARVSPDYLEELNTDLPIKKDYSFYKRLEEIFNRYPSIAGFFWAVVDTLKRGVYISVPITIVSRLGKEKKFSAQNLVIPAACALGSVGFYALHEGVREYYNTDTLLDSTYAATAFNTVYKFKVNPDTKRMAAKIAVFKSHKAAKPVLFIASAGLAGFIILKRLGEV